MLQDTSLQPNFAKIQAKAFHVAKFESRNTPTARKFQKQFNGSLKKFPIESLKNLPFFRAQLSLLLFSSQQFHKLALMGNLVPKSRPQSTQLASLTERGKYFSPKIARSLPSNRGHVKKFPAATRNQKPPKTKERCSRVQGRAEMFLPTRAARDVRTQSQKSRSERFLCHDARSSTKFCRSRFRAHSSAFVIANLPRSSAYWPRATIIMSRSMRIVGADLTK